MNVIQPVEISVRSRFGSAVTSPFGGSAGLRRSSQPLRSNRDDVAEQEAALTALKARSPTSPTGLQDSPLLDKPKGIIEETLNFLYSKQKEIGRLSQRLDKAVRKDEKDAILKEIDAQTKEYERAKDSKDFKQALDVLQTFQAELSHATSHEQREAIRKQIVANKEILGDRVANLLTSSSDQAIGKIVTNLQSALTTELSTKGATAGAYRLFGGQSDSEIGDKAALEVAAKNDILSGGRGMPTREVFNLKFDTEKNRADSLALLDSLSSSFELLAQQISTGQSLEIPSADEPAIESKKPIRDPKEAANEARLLQNKLKGSTLVELLNAGTNIDANRAVNLLY